MLAVSGFFYKHNCMCHARARVVIVPPIPGFFYKHNCMCHARAFSLPTAASVRIGNR